MKRFPDKVRARAVERYLRGDLCSEIADDVGCSLSCLNAWTKAAKRSRHGQYRHSARVRAEAVRLYVQMGYSSPETAEILGDGIRSATVIRWVRQAGQPVRPPSKRISPRAQQILADVRAELASKSMNQETR